MKKNIKKIDNKSLNNYLKKVWSADNFNTEGSYTGMALDDQKPVQDQDDL